MLRVDGHERRPGGRGLRPGRRRGRRRRARAPAPPRDDEHASSTPRGSGLATPMSLDVTTTSSSASRPVGREQSTHVASSMTAVSVTAPMRWAPASAAHHVDGVGEGSRRERVDRRAGCRFLARACRRRRRGPRRSPRWWSSVSLQCLGQSVEPGGVGDGDAHAVRDPEARRVAHEHCPGAPGGRATRARPGRARSWRPTARARDRRRAAARSSSSRAALIAVAHLVRSAPARSSGTIAHADGARPTTPVGGPGAQPRPRRRVRRRSRRAARGTRTPW